jgi:Holliday junction resolvase
MGKGKQYENTLTNEIDRATNDTVNVYPVGYSGSHATTAEDILVTDASTGLNYALEVKKIASDYCYIDAEQLEALVARDNGHTVSALVISFSHREPIVTRYYDSVSGVDGAESYNDKSVLEKFATLLPDCTDARITDSNKLAISKPSTDDWPSAQSGSDDVDAICSGLGIVTEKSIKTEM